MQKKYSELFYYPILFIRYEYNLRLVYKKEYKYFVLVPRG